MALKHVGRMKKNQRKVIVAYRVVPGEPENAIVVTTENLMADEHDALIKAVESDAGQTSYEFAEAMARTQLPDGRNMLAGFHTTGKMVKVATKDVEMVPDSKTTIALDELNSIIAKQKGISVEDLALKPDGSTPKTNKEATATNDLIVEEYNLDAPAEVVQAAQEANNEVMSDDELAAKYRSDADRLFKEAKRLREQAEELAPTKKKAAKTKAEESA